MIDSNMKLTGKNAEEFQNSMLHIDEDALAKRDAFIKDIHTYYDTDGVLTIDCSDMHNIKLPNNFGESYTL